MAGGGCLSFQQQGKHICPGYPGSIQGRISIQAGLNVKQDPVSQTTNTKRAESVAQEVVPALQVQGPEFRKIIRK
jgi:hypothetical protein